MTQSSEGIGCEISATTSAAIQTSCAETDPAFFEASQAATNNHASMMLRISSMALGSVLLHALTLLLWLVGLLANDTAVLGFAVSALLAFPACAAESVRQRRQVA